MTRCFVAGLQGASEGHVAGGSMTAPSVVRSACVVLDAGRIAEVGTYNQLVAAGGSYSKLWQAWSESRCQVDC
jgi:ATP-binding cassette subfamily C protein